MFAVIDFVVVVVVVVGGGGGGGGGGLVPCSLCLFVPCWWSWQCFLCFTYFVSPSSLMICGSARHVLVSTSS